MNSGQSVHSTIFGLGNCKHPGDSGQSPDGSPTSKISKSSRNFAFYSTKMRPRKRECRKRENYRKFQRYLSFLGPRALLKKFISFFLNVYTMMGPSALLKITSREVELFTIEHTYFVNKQDR